MAKKLTKISNKSYNIYKNQILNNKPFIFTVAIVTIVFVAILILYSQIAGLDREILKQKALNHLNKLLKKLCINLAWFILQKIK